MPVLLTGGPMRILTVILSLTLAVSAQTKPADTAADHLPIKRVVLYKNGVGYFEHVGKVHGTQDVNIDFTTSQLDDVLKSLTIVDYGEGRVTGVRYNSTAPLDQRLRGLRIPLGENPPASNCLMPFVARASKFVTERHLLPARSSASRPARARTHAPTKKSASPSSPSSPTPVSCARSSSIPVTSVRIADRDLNLELARYMNVIGSSRAKDVRRMTLSASGTGERDLFVSYVSEVPIWKTTYRIIIPPDPKKQPLLQGWAVVDNTIGEDWKDVKLSLVAGAPQSFVQQISTPYYARRPVIALPETAQLSPQTHEAGLTVDGTDKNSDTVAAIREDGAPPPPAPPPPPATGGPAQYDRLQLYSNLQNAPSARFHGDELPRRLLRSRHRHRPNRCHRVRREYYRL